MCERVRSGSREAAQPSGDDVLVSGDDDVAMKREVPSEVRHHGERCENAQFFCSDCALREPREEEEVEN